MLNDAINESIADSFAASALDKSQKKNKSTKNDCYSCADIFENKTLSGMIIWIEVEVEGF
jgi:uncharacterized membrane protein